MKKELKIVEITAPNKHIGDAMGVFYWKTNTIYHYDKETLYKLVREHERIHAQHFTGGKLRWFLRFSMNIAGTRWRFVWLALFGFMLLVNRSSVGIFYTVSISSGLLLLTFPYLLLMLEEYLTTEQAFKKVFKT